MNYAEAAQSKSVIVHLTLWDIKTFYGSVEVNGGDVRMKSSPQTKAMVANTTIVYKIFDVASKKIAYVDIKKVDKCLAPVWEQIMYDCRGRTWRLNYASKIPRRGEK